LEASDYMCEAFIKTTRLFEDIFREMETSQRNLDFFDVGLFKEFEAFLNYFQIN
jgi:hypothetical protein